MLSITQQLDMELRGRGVRAARGMPEALGGKGNCGSESERDAPHRIQNQSWLKLFRTLRFADRIVSYDGDFEAF